MTGRLGGLRWRLIVVPATAAMLTFGLSAAADAATSMWPASHSGLELRTLVDRVHIRTAPSLQARIIGHLGKAGARVVVNCYARGSRVAGNAVWYHLVRPREGYVTSYYTNTHLDPVRGLLRCGAHPGFSRTYHTVVGRVLIRYRPSAFAAAVKRLGGTGSRVVVDCFAYGQSIRGDRVWYHTVAPMLAYVAGRHLNTGRDPARGVPRCQ